MATWYVDYEGGSDNNSGDSFAVDATATDGVANGTTTFTSATGGFTGKANRKIFIVGIGGRTISSVTNDNTVVLNATVSSGSGKTWNIGGRRQNGVNMTTANCQGIAAGDTIRLKASKTPTALVASSYWMSQASTVVLGVTAKTTLADCESNWTAATNVTCTLATPDFMVGSNSVQVAIGAAFTTGKAAYFATGTLNLSTRQCLGFWIKQTSGTLLATGGISFRLCSDNAGVTTVNTFAVPALEILSQWYYFAIDLGSAAGSSIQSVALYVDTDVGAQTFKIDQVEIFDAPSSVTKVIDGCDSGWSAATNVTVTHPTTRKQGTGAMQAVVAAAFTTGKAAFHATGTLDLSGYKQVSFWIKQTAGTLLATSGMSIRLCSDTAGATPVNTIAIPPLTGGALSHWYAFTVDTGGALGSSIQSVALYVDTDVGAQTVIIDHIIACKDSTSNDSLSLSSLIGHADSTSMGGADTDSWYAIQSIVDHVVRLDNGVDTEVTTAAQGWYGTSGFKAAYKREPILSAVGTTFYTHEVAGSAGNAFTVSGGWNRTDMSTQTSDWTWAGNPGTNAITYSNTLTYVSWNNLASSRGSTGFQLAGSASNNTFNHCAFNNGSSNGIANGTTTVPTTMDNCFAMCNTAAGFNCYDLVSTTTLYAQGNLAQGYSLAGATLATVYASNNGTYGLYNNPNSGVTNGIIVNATTVTANFCGTYGIYLAGSYGASVFGTVTANSNLTGGINCATGANTFGNVTANYNITTGVTVSGNWNIFNNVTVQNNGSYGINVLGGMNNTFNYASTSGNGLASVFFLQTSTVSNNRFNSCTFAEGTIFGTSAPSGYSYDSVAYSTRHQNTDNNHLVQTSDRGSCISQTSVRHTASGLAWQMNPLSNAQSGYELNLSLGRYAIASGSRTVSLWLRRDDTGLTLGIRCRAYQLPGITSDQTAFMTASANTWEQVSITLNPTSDGAVELEAIAYGGTTYNGYVDDLTVDGKAAPLDYAWGGQPIGYLTVTPPPPSSVGISPVGLGSPVVRAAD